MEVTLTLPELRSAAHSGIERRLNALAKKRRGAHGFDRDFEAWSIDIEGLAAEAAAAKALGIAYVPVTGRLDTADGDLGPGLQVRSTRYNTGHLLVHDSDADTDRFILVAGLAPAYRVCGWAFGSEAKTPANWRVYKGRGAYWVGQPELRPIATLEV